MIAMGMVQLPLVEIILMISVGNGRMSTVLVSTSTINRGTRRGILLSNFEHMLIIVSLM
jgi:hypothetical protein